MAPIERKPLPPPHANVTTITEADRAELIARASEVIDHYLNGAGSYWDEGPRKPLEETLRDLRDFRETVIASKQLADDPSLVLDSVDDQVQGAIGRVEQAIEDSEGRDGIRVPPPETNDRIIRAPTNAPMAISHRDGTPADRGGIPRIATRFLSGKIIGGTPTNALDARTTFQSEVLQEAPLLGLVSGKPTPNYPVRPPIWNFPWNSAPKDDQDDWLMRLLPGVRSS